MKKYTATRLRGFEKRVIKAFKQGKINCPIHLSGGNEQQLLDIFKKIHTEDWVFSTHRNYYHYLLKGGDSNRLFDELCGKRTGCCGGNGRSMHIHDSSINFVTSGIVAGGCAMAVGVALGLKLQKKKGHVWCFIGDGATDSGHTYEAIRYGYTMKLPITFVIEDNDMSIETSKIQRHGDGHRPLCGSNICYYTYTREYPHVGIGQHVTF